MSAARVVNIREVHASPPPNPDRLLTPGLGDLSGFELRRSERFWKSVRRGAPDECWTWTKSLSRAGYGRLNWSRPHVNLAHRASWLLSRGPIPEGLFVCHRCDNPPCVNPSHLFLGTVQENVSDMVSKGRAARGERTSNAKLTADDVRWMRFARQYAGVSLRALGPAFGVTWRNAGYVLERRSWRHV